MRLVAFCSCVILWILSSSAIGESIEVNFKKYESLIEATEPTVDSANLMREKTDPRAKRSVVVNVNSNLLRSEKVFNIDIFGDSFQVKIDRSESINRFKSIRAKILGVQDSFMRLTIMPSGEIVGAIDIAAKQYSLSPLAGDQHLLEELDFSQTSETSCLSSEHAKQTSTEPVKVLSENNEPVPSPVSDDSETLIDWMFVYTADAIGGDSKDQFEALLSNEIGRINDAFELSGVNQRLRLVCMFQIDYQGPAGNLLEFVYSMQDPDDEILDQVPDWRDQCGADGVTGIMSAVGGFGFLNTNPEGSSDRTYSAVGRSTLGSPTVAHEIGHNLGCAHDRDNTSNAGAFDYSYGYRTVAPCSNQNRTIMAYSPGVQVMRFSGPDVIYNNCAMGTENDDNVRTMNNTRTIMASFRDPTLLEWETIADTGVAGRLGKPTILGQGTKNGLIPLKFTISNTYDNANCLFILGFSQNQRPFKAGTLIPTADFVLPFQGNEDGVSFEVPPGNFDQMDPMYVQVFCSDFVAAQATAISDAVKIITP